jgi:hypothetical protein
MYNHNHTHNTHNKHITNSSLTGKMLQHQKFSTNNITTNKSQITQHIFQHEQPPQHRSEFVVFVVVGKMAQAQWERLVECRAAGQAPPRALAATAGAGAAPTVCRGFRLGAGRVRCRAHAHGCRLRVAPQVGRRRGVGCTRGS